MIYFLIGLSIILLKKEKKKEDGIKFYRSNFFEKNWNWTWNLDDLGFSNSWSGIRLFLFRHSISRGILLDSRFAEFVSLPRSYREFRITYVCKWWVRRRGDAPLPGNGGEVRAIRDSNGRGDLFIFSPSERRSLTGVFAGRPSRSGDRFDALKFCSSIFSLSPSLFFPFYPFFPRENRSFREFSAQQFRLNF